MLTVGLLLTVLCVFSATGRDHGRHNGDSGERHHGDRDGGRWWDRDGGRWWENYEWENWGSRENHDDDTDGLSAGAIAGIVIAVVLFLAFITAVIFLCAKRQALIQAQKAAIYSAKSPTINTSKVIPPSVDKKTLPPLVKTPSAPGGPLESFTVPASHWQDPMVAYPAPPPYYATLPPIGHSTALPAV